jgi:hypothetical protein
MLLPSQLQDFIPLWYGIGSKDDNLGMLFITRTEKSGKTNWFAGDSIQHIVEMTDISDVSEELER